MNSLLHLLQLQNQFTQLPKHVTIYINHDQGYGMGFQIFLSLFGVSYKKFCGGGLKWHAPKAKTG